MDAVSVSASALPGPIDSKAPTQALLEDEGQFDRFSVREVEQAVSTQFPLSAISQTPATTFWFTNESNEKSYSFSNDLDFRKNIEAVSELPVRKTSRDTIITIGEGAQFSMLGEISRCCAIAFTVDRNPALLHFLKASLTALQDAPAETEPQTFFRNIFRTLFRSHPQWLKQEEDLMQSLENYMASAGHRFCLSSPEALTESQKALKDCCFIPVELNLFDKAGMQRFCELLTEFQLNVRYLGLSNVFDYGFAFYIENPYQGEVMKVEPTIYLKQLPLQQNCLCTYSVMMPEDTYIKHCHPNELFPALNKVHSDTIVSFLFDLIAFHKGEPSLLSKKCKAAIHKHQEYVGGIPHEPFLTENMSDQLTLEDTLKFLASSCQPFAMTGKLLRKILPVYPESSVLEVEKKREEIKQLLHKNPTFIANPYLCSEFMDILNCALEECK